MAKLTLLAVSPKVNPDRMIVKLTPAANYVQGAPDTFDMSQIADPQGIGQVPLNNPPLVTPALYNENLSGYYCAVIKGNAINNYGLKYYTPGGNEINTGAMPAQIANGEISLEILVPTDQQN
jgi:hypothetical protein